MDEWLLVVGCSSGRTHGVGALERWRGCLMRGNDVDVVGDARGAPGVLGYAAGAVLGSTLSLAPAGAIHAR